MINYQSPGNSTNKELLTPQLFEQMELYNEKQLFHG
jgi:hypothetical protein